MEITKKDINLFLIYAVLLVIIMVGTVMNFKAVTLNGGKMPVLLSYDYQSEKHFGFQDFSEVKVPYLTDIFTIGNNHFSFGDVFLITGAVGFLSLYTFLLFSRYTTRKKEKLI